MCTIKEMIQRLDYVGNNLIPMTGEVLNEADVEFNICELNRNQLYEEGEGSDKKKLMSYRSSFYAEFKANMRGGKELTDLYLSGQFQRNFHIIISGDQYSILSSDWKNQKLIDKYGERIFGLTEENKIEANKIIKPSLLEKVNTILQCTIN